MNKTPLDLYIFYSFTWQLNPVIRFVPYFHHFVPSLKPQKKLGFAFNMPCLTKRNTIETDPTKLIFIIDMFLRILCMILYRKAFLSQNSVIGKSMFLSQKLAWFFLSFYFILFLKWKVKAKSMTMPKHWSIPSDHIYICTILFFLSTCYFLYLWFILYLNECH